MTEKWTKEEEELVRKHWGGTSREDLKKLLPKRTWESVSKKAHRFQIKRDDGSVNHN